ncbi:conserved hypothetical protein [Verticillium alfalfae VaMs.102]|uniref:Karyogamy protein n=1 Tax=Verticillium alfalfae (strain VaMs.102 / ATCC MYA-4576 / FGSC 10136) TaxID=526221 RepID=C9SI45_VERA1|nr:conserved hypothetical protein [Verticillium alfalfae VaMs.102]EEY18618.1 conserved hypothetical protein [Verticillium alfalfae VaMs.102]
MDDVVAPGGTPGPDGGAGVGVLSGLTPGFQSSGGFQGSSPLTAPMTSPAPAPAPASAPATTARLPRSAPFPGPDELAAGLAFSDVSDELFQLRPQFDNNNNNNSSPTITASNPSHTTSPSLSRSTLASNPATPYTGTASTSPSTQPAATSQSNTPTSTAQPRRPSPGLAARLKALGFGTSNKKSPDPSPTAPQHDRIGRLPEDQIRQLEKIHRANSVNSIIERRGRPWKGATAPLHRSKSIADDSSDRPQATQTTESTPVHAPLQLTVAVPETAPSNAFLPEIAASEPLNMDTQKYRLPDHTNGNGTKVQLETRQEHLERTARPPSPDEDPSLPPTSPPTLRPNHQRPGSIYTLSRASFANQLAQLTSLQLPDAGSLASKVSAIPTADQASKALINAAEQIRSWIQKASEVIAGLDSEDDVEWAAAGGREGLAEVESAAARFEDLINVYVGAIEKLQCREDIALVPPGDLKRAVAQMEAIINEWAIIGSTLNTVKQQVEIAMEWEELWNNVLGDIQGEMDELCRLVFEMEERRHKSLMAATTNDTVDIGDLETIVEETPPQQTKLQVQNRFSLSTFPMSPSSPGTPTLSQDDSSLLALFARMQPLKASLEFLPMRLSVFEARAEKSFPTACEELDMRRNGLDGTYKKLEKDAESLRKELGEDRWVLVFRGAGRQAQKMIESVERSLLKLKDSVDEGHHLTSAPALSKKIESYDAKRTHYGPAIERVLSIIDKGVKDRLTVNGEILRLLAEMEAKWGSLKGQMADMDATLDEIHVDQRAPQLRDSVSSMLSNDRSTIDSGRETPGSSPPSSVIMSSLGLDPITPTGKPRNVRSTGSNGKASHPSNRRYSSMPTPASQVSRKPLTSRMSTLGTSNLPTPGGKIPRPGSTLVNRPKWNLSSNTSDVGTGHNFKPLSLTTPSPYAKKTPTTARTASSLTPSSGHRLTPAGRSPLNRSSSASPMLEETPTKPSASRLSFRDRIASPGPYSQQVLSKPRFASSVSASSVSTTGNRRASLQPPRLGQPDPVTPARPASSLAAGRRVSMLPQPRTMGANGRDSPQLTAGTRSALGMRNNSNLESSATTAGAKPRWRH